MKTLKDVGCVCIGDEPFHDFQKCEDQLRQVAQEHYDAEMGEWEEHKEHVWAQAYKNRAEWIKYFFNL